MLFSGKSISQNCLIVPQLKGGVGTTRHGTIRQLLKSKLFFKNKILPLVLNYAATRTFLLESCNATEMSLKVGQQCQHHAGEGKSLMSHFSACLTVPYVPLLIFHFFTELYYLYYFISYNY